MRKFSGNQVFANLLAAKRQEIFQRTNDGVQETKTFQRLHSLFSECRRKNSESDFRLIIISKSDLLNLSDDAEVRAAALFRDTRFLTNSTVYVNSTLSILDSNNDPFPVENNNARRYFALLSATKDEWVVFLIAPDATVNYFIDGHEYGSGVFYTLEEQKNYEQLRTIDHLQEVLDEYRIYLTRQDAYVKFFVAKSGLCALHSISESTDDQGAFVKKHRQLLRNKPEYIFQEDMRNYIKQHMNVFVRRETLLEDLDRLDIELTDHEGRELFFIEIKWVGRSIGSNGGKLGTEYHVSPRIQPDAVIQVLRYIGELLNEKANIKIGYLAVFDARDDDLPDTGEGITEADVPEEFREHYPRFVKLKDFRVKNENPR